jgi:hypothetical protein
MLLLPGKTFTATALHRIFIMGLTILLKPVNEIKLCGFCREFNLAVIIPGTNRCGYSHISNGYHFLFTTAIITPKFPPS